MNPYYQDKWVTIYHGDCREILPQLDVKVDLVLTDPPYGINHPTNYMTRGRGKLAQCKDYLPVHGDNHSFEPKFILDMNCPAVLWGADHYSDKLPLASGWLVWDKERPDNLDQATCELAWTNFIKGTRRFRFMWNGMLRASDEYIYHPTQKPEALIEWILTLKWTPTGLVLDPFLGSGTTCYCAKKLNRYSIGIEIEEKYCEIAARRCSQEVMELSGIGGLHNAQP